MLYLVLLLMLVVVQVPPEFAAVHLLVCFTLRDLHGDLADHLLALGQLFDIRGETPEERKLVCVLQNCLQERCKTVFQSGAVQAFSLLVGVVFDNMNPDGSLPPHVVYKIRQNATFSENTKFVRDRYWYPGPRWGNKYYKFGFTWIQVTWKETQSIFAETVGAYISWESVPEVSSNVSALLCFVPILGHYRACHHWPTCRTWCHRARVIHTSDALPLLHGRQVGMSQ